MVYRFLSISFIRTNHTGWASFNPARNIHTGQWILVIVSDSAFGVLNSAVVIVKRHFGHGRTSVAYRPKHHTHGDYLFLICCPRFHAAVFICIGFVLHDFDRRDSAIFADKFSGRNQKTNGQVSAVVLLGSLGELLDNRDVFLHIFITGSIKLCLTGRI